MTPKQQLAKKRDEVSQLLNSPMPIKPADVIKESVAIQEYATAIKVAHPEFAEQAERRVRKRN